MRPAATAPVDHHAAYESDGCGGADCDIHGDRDGHRAAELSMAERAERIVELHERRARVGHSEPGGGEYDGGHERIDVSRHREQRRESCGDQQCRDTHSEYGENGEQCDGADLPQSTSHVYRPKPE